MSTKDRRPEATPGLVRQMQAFGEQLESFCQRISNELVFERADLTSECAAVRDEYRALLEEIRRQAGRSDETAGR